MLAVVSASPGFAQTPPLSDDQLTAKRQEYGGAMALQYGIDNCDIETTAKQRADVRNKIAELKQQGGISGDISTAELKDALGLKTDDDLKNYCTGLHLTLPGSIAGLLADKPPSEWSKPTQNAQAAPAQPAPAPAASAPSGPKTVAGDWEVEPMSDAPGQCMVTRDYLDKDDNNAENVIIVRNGPDKFGLAFSYAKWNWDAGEKVAASLVTSDAIIDADAKWTADKTGKVLTTFLPNTRLPALKSSAELIVKFNDGDAAFEVPRLNEALAALSACAAGK